MGGAAFLEKSKTFVTNYLSAAAECRKPVEINELLLADDDPLVEKFLTEQVRYQVGLRQQLLRAIQNILAS